ncbi:MAG: acetylglutamate kinase [Verrucomicrobia bacterium]|nr:acetylglutamate kinase [Cytophagales bacterium]
MLKKLTVVKIGGNIIDEPVALAKFLHHFSIGAEPKILVHGGGKLATQMAEKLGLPTQMIDGRRITDEPTLDIVTMVYAGLINKKIVAQLQGLGCNALGLTGADAGILLAKKRQKSDIDYGFAGDIEKVNASQLLNFLRQNLILVIAPLTFDETGQLLNTNADTMASAIAIALASHLEISLIYCFEKKGVLENPEDDNSVIEEISKEKYEVLKKEGVVSKGMIPKLDNAFAALENGVKNVRIIHADNIVTKTGTLLIL